MSFRSISSLLLAIIFGFIIGALVGAYHSGADDGVRAWFGALSGWIAAISAGLAAFFTIKKMQGQIEAVENQNLKLEKQVANAEEQMKFVVGDMEPELFFTRSNRADMAHIHVQNYNRRPIRINSISVGGLRNIQIRLERQGMNINAQETQQDGNYVRQFAVGNNLSGWTNRNEPAPENTYPFYLELQDDEVRRQRVVGHTPIAINYSIFGDTQANREKSVNFSINEWLPNLPKDV